jgi:hypothetical protein
MTFVVQHASGRYPFSGRHLVRAAAVATLTAAFALSTGCGGKEYDPNADVGPPPAQQGAAGPQANAGAAAPVAKPAPTPGEEKTANMATAVADGKPSAPIDMKYEMLAKPGVAQPFEVELVFLPRITADKLEVSVTDAPGLVVVGERAIVFEKIEGGQPYSMKVLLRGDAPGLYYLSATASVATPVQTETRAFAVPVVIGTPAPAEKPAVQTDAKGQAVQSMPAKEN